MCSPTRSCLLTGRNHHTNGMGMISELAQGYPGYDGMPKPSRGYISEILHEQGFATYALGKWHQVPAEEMTMAGPFDRWPLGRGFDRFYGFLGAETDQYHPDLVYDNHYVEPPETRGGLSPHRGPDRQGDCLPPRSAFGRPDQAVLHVLLPRREARAAPGPVANGSRNTRASSMRAGMPIAKQPINASSSWASSRPARSSRRAPIWVKAWETLSTPTSSASTRA